MNIKQKTKNIIFTGPLEQIYHSKSSSFPWYSILHKLANVLKTTKGHNIQVSLTEFCGYILESAPVSIKNLP